MKATFLFCTVLVHTSGSTGTPKPLRVEKQRMMQSAMLTVSFLGLKQGDTALLCMPLKYIAGKMVVSKLATTSNSSSFDLRKKAYWRQKKLNMFLRWMIRRDSEVDLGVWESFDRKDLIVPLDTHVCRVAYYFKLTDTETFSLKNARRITAALAEVFPDDPCLGDFALFGLGVNGEI